MKFEIIYEKEVVVKDIPVLSKKMKERVREAIETKLVHSPQHFGKPLRRSLKGYRKLRVGDYRVVFRIEGRRVKIFLIQHRSIVYEIAPKRIIE